MIAYLPVVYDSDGRGAIAARTGKCTLEDAKGVLDAERERAGSPVLRWRDEFGGSICQTGSLTYEVLLIEVDL